MWQQAGHDYADPHHSGHCHPARTIRDAIERDPAYSAYMSGVRITPLGCARFVGSQATIELEGRLTTHLTVWTSVVLFQAGAFLKDTPPGLNTRYLAGHATYRF